MDKLLDLILVYGEIPNSISQAHEIKEDQDCVSVFSVVAKMFVTYSKVEWKDRHFFFLLIERPS